MKPGIYRELTRDEYERIDAVNQSRLKAFARSAAHGRHAMLNPKLPTDAMSVGTALHMAVLEPERFKAEYVVAPKCDRRTNAGKAEWASFQAANAARSLLNPDEMESCIAMSAALHVHPLAGPLLRAPGVSEVAAVWKDSETGLLCKGRLDKLTRFVGQNLIIDVKSTRNAQPPEQDEHSCLFGADALKLGYLFQAAFYLDGLAALQPAERGYWILAVENEAPHAVAVYELPDEAIEYGRTEYRRALKRYADAKRTDCYPGYHEGKHILNLPRWARQTMEVEA